MKAVKYYGVIVQELTLTAPTVSITGLSNYEDLQAAENTLFDNLDDAEMLATIAKIYGGKLKPNDLLKIKKMSKEEKRQHAVENLTIKTVLVQEREANVSDSKSSKVFSLFQDTRINVGRTESLKYAYQTATFGSLKKQGIKPEIDLAALLAESGTLLYIQRITDFEAEVNDDGRIVSEPKRKGNGGNIMTKDGKLMFMHNDLIVEPNLTDEECNALYATLYNEETANEEAMISDPDGDLDAEEIPAATKVQGGKGAFEPQFEQWLVDYYNENNVGSQTEIRSQEVVAEAAAIVATPAKKRS